jgi:serine/threonine protein kinase
MLSLQYIKKLGEGGFGYVYLARDRDYERFVAVKEMKINAQDVDATEKEIKGGKNRQELSVSDTKD